MSNHWLFDAIVLTALAVPVLRYVVAFQQAEPMLQVMSLNLDISPLTGLAFGLSYEASVFVGLREATSARRRGLKTWWWPLMGATAQMVVGVAIVLPVLVAELRAESLAAMLGAFGCWIWGALVALATVLTFATCSLALAVQPHKRESSGQVVGESGQIVRASGQKAQSCPHCGRKFGSKQAVAAHLRRCAAYERAETQGESDVVVSDLPATSAGE
jgi:hypothetical protein